MSSLLTLCLSVALFIAVLGVDNCSAHETIIGTCTSTSHGSHAHRYDSNCKHHHEDHHHHTPNLNFHRRSKLPEELAEEEDLMSHDFEFQHHDISYDVSAMGLWIRAMGCSLLVSMASLICLILLPVILFKGKPSKTVVDCLAIFGAGAMLGDAFLHQLPHAFGGKHMHVHEHHVYHAHSHFDYNEHDHAHSLSELSIGLSILSGIVLFLIVEKIVRHVENLSRNGGYVWGYGHHHHKHHHTHVRRSDKDGCQDENIDSKSVDAWNNLDSIQNNCMDEQKVANNETIRKRVTSGSVKDDKNQDAVSSSAAMKLQDEKGTVLSSNIVFGYLNLFSDGVHNFTDGMALGSAFLLHGSVGGWSRTLFLLAHEIPQEIGDFGILLRSGFSVSKALFFNFLSALVALGGTALALILGKDPGHSSLIEGFTAGGFIYIAVAGVLPEMNNGSSSSIKSTIIQVASLILGMAVALGISLVE